MKELWKEVGKRMSVAQPAGHDGGGEGLAGDPAASPPNPGGPEPKLRLRRPARLVARSGHEEARQEREVS